MMLLALGFIVFCVGGTVFMKGESDRGPGDARVAISLAVHAANVVGLALMAAGAVLMLAAGIL
jgi:hypothetical protein